MKFCGPKLSLCGLVISVWGVIQLVFMGIFYYINSVSLLEDLPLDNKINTKDEFYAEAEKAYSQNAYNCWIAACLYIFTMLVSGHQFYVNNRSNI